MNDMIERLREAVRTLDHDISCEMGETPSTDEEMEKHGWYMLQAGDMTSPPDDLRRKHRQELIAEMIEDWSSERAVVNPNVQSKILKYLHGQRESEQ